MSAALPAPRPGSPGDIVVARVRDGGRTLEVEAVVTGVWFTVPAAGATRHPDQHGAAAAARALKDRRWRETPHGDPAPVHVEQRAVFDIPGTGGVEYLLARDEYAPGETRASWLRELRHGARATARGLRALAADPRVRTSPRAAAAGERVAAALAPHDPPGPGRRPGPATARKTHSSGT